MLAIGGHYGLISFLSRVRMILYVGLWLHSTLYKLCIANWCVMCLHSRPTSIFTGEWCRCVFFFRARVCPSHIRKNINEREGENSFLFCVALVCLKIKFMVRNKSKLNCIYFVGCGLLTQKPNRLEIQCCICYEIEKLLISCHIMTECQRNLVPYIPHVNDT